MPDPLKTYAAMVGLAWACALITPEYRSSANGPATLVTPELTSVQGAGQAVERLLAGLLQTTHAACQRGGHSSTAQACGAALQPRGED